MDALIAAVLTMCSASVEDIERLSHQIEKDKVDAAIRNLRRMAKPKGRVQRSAELANHLEKCREKLRNVFTKEVEDLVGRPPGNEEDYRIIDVRLVDGTTPTDQAALRRVFAERSLATDFDISNPTKLQEMRKAQSFTIPKGRNMSMREFARRRFQKSNEETVRKALVHGLKLLLLQENFGPGILGPVAFAHKQVMTMGYDEIKRTLSEMEWLTELVPDTWIDKAQSYYDTQGPRAVSTNESGRDVMDRDGQCVNLGYKHGGGAAGTLVVSCICFLLTIPRLREWR
jgi:hypothetical protein